MHFSLFYITKKKEKKLNYFFLSFSQKKKIWTLKKNGSQNFHVKGQEFDVAWQFLEYIKNSVEWGGGGKKAWGLMTHFSDWKKLSYGCIWSVCPFYMHPCSRHQREKKNAGTVYSVFFFQVEALFLLWASPLARLACPSQLKRRKDFLSLPSIVVHIIGFCWTNTTLQIFGLHLSVWSIEKKRRESPQCIFPKKWENFPFQFFFFYFTEFHAAL